MPYQTPRYLRESGTSADKLPQLVREQYEDLRLLTEDFKNESSPEYTETDDHLFLAVKQLHSSGRLEATAESVGLRYDPNKFDPIVLWRDPSTGGTTCFPATAA